MTAALGQYGFCGLDWQTPTLLLGLAFCVAISFSTIQSKA